MPELPEVEVVCRGLSATILNRQIKAVLYNGKKLRQVFSPNLFQQTLGQTVSSVSRYAKFILIHLSQGQIIVVHLGMTGSLLFEPGRKKSEELKHGHVVIEFADDAILTFVDPRRFGFVILLDNEQAVKHLTRNFAPDPFDPAMNSQLLFERLAKKSAPIKPTLLDQQIMSGLGNIYVCEVLFATHIHPATPAKNLSKSQVDQVFEQAQKIMTKAIQAGGSSFTDYQHVDGGHGSFQGLAKVYKRNGKPCANGCGSLIEMIRQAGRSTFFCPTCQK